MEAANKKEATLQFISDKRWLEFKSVFRDSRPQLSVIKVDRE